MKKKFFVGMQSWFMTQFIDEGVKNALQNMIDQGGVNALLLGTHKDYESSKKYSRRTRSEKRRFVELDGFNFDIKLEYYKRTKIKPIKTEIEELKNRDIFKEVSSSAKNMGLKVFALIEHRFPNVDKYKDLFMRAINGNKIPKVLCHNNPEILRFYKCMIDNLDSEYNLDGFCLALVDHYALYGFKSLTDELADSLGIEQFPIPELGLSCFCDTCVCEAEKMGIDVEKVKKGLMKSIRIGYIPKKVEKMVYADDAMRFLQEVPEFLVWLSFRSSRMEKLHKELYKYIKSKNSNYEVGLDIYGAREDWKYQMRFDKLVKYCDWIKPMFYSSVTEVPLEPEQIGEGVKVAKELSGKPIFPGISCLIDNDKMKIRNSFNCAIKNNADGVVLSWDYALISNSNMRLIKDIMKRLDLI